MIKNDVVLEKARGFVRKASKHFPEFVTQLLKAIEREDIPADPEDDHVKFSNETSQTDEIEEENTKEWIPNALLNRCLYDIGNNFPLMVRDYLLPYVKTAIVVSVSRLNLLSYWILVLMLSIYYLSRLIGH